MSNANAALPEMEVQLDKKRKLVIDFNALCLIESVTKRNALFDMELWSRPSASELRAIIWGALRTDDKQLTLEQAGELIAQYPTEITEILTWAFKNAVESATLQKKSKGKG